MNPMTVHRSWRCHGNWLRFDVWGPWWGGAVKAVWTVVGPSFQGAACKDDAEAERYGNGLRTEPFAILGASWMKSWMIFVTDSWDLGGLQTLQAHEELRGVQWIFLPPLGLRMWWCQITTHNHSSSTRCCSVYGLLAAQWWSTVWTQVRWSSCLGSNPKNEHQCWQHSCLNAESIGACTLNAHFQLPIYLQLASISVHRNIT